MIGSSLFAKWENIQLFNYSKHNNTYLKGITSGLVLRNMYFIISAYLMKDAAKPI